MSFLDLDERLIDLAGLVNICYTPIANVKVFPENVDIVLVEGAVANQDHLHDLRLIRQRSKILVSFGDCAVTGNVTALRNLLTVDDILNRAYREAPIVEGIPSGNDIVPKLLPRVLRLHNVVTVDHFLPGCPPSANAIHDFLTGLLAGSPPTNQGRKFGA